jgi:hypothetical protein
VRDWVIVLTDLQVSRPPVALTAAVTLLRFGVSLIESFQARPPSLRRDDYEK